MKIERKGMGKGDEQRQEVEEEGVKVGRERKEGRERGKGEESKGMKGWYERRLRSMKNKRK